MSDSNDEQLRESFRNWKKDPDDVNLFLIYLAFLARFGRLTELRLTFNFWLASNSPSGDIPEEVAKGILAIVQINPSKLLKVWASTYNLSYKMWIGAGNIGSLGVASYYSKQHLLYTVGKMVLPLRDIFGADVAETVLRRLDQFAYQEAKRTARGLSWGLYHQEQWAMIEIPLGLVSYSTKKFPGKEALCCFECQKYNHRDGRDFMVYYSNFGNLYSASCHVCGRVMKGSGAAAIYSRPE